MIRVEVQDYCAACLDFEADVIKPFHRATDPAGVYTDTVIRCSHAKRCEAIKRYLEKQANDERKV